MDDNWFDPFDAQRQNELVEDQMREAAQSPSNPNDGANYVYPERPEAHHIYPQEFRDWFEEKMSPDPGDERFKVDDWCMKIERDMHQDLNPWWNREWQEFINDNPNASPADIENKAYDMMERSGLLDLHTEQGAPIHGFEEFRPHYERE